MPDSSLPSTVTDPYDAIDRGFTKLQTIAAALDAERDIDAIVDELLAMERDLRFTASIDEVADFTDVDPEAVFDLVENVIADVQHDLFRRALLAPESEEHMILGAALQVAQENLAAVDHAAEPRELYSSVLALAVRLHEIAQNEEITDEDVREISLAEFHRYRATDEPLGRHPDSVMPVQIRADLRVYGAAIACVDLDLPPERGGRLANEDLEDFEEILDTYGVEVPEA